MQAAVGELNSLPGKSELVTIQLLRPRYDSLAANRTGLCTTFRSHDLVQPARNPCSELAGRSDFPKQSRDTAPPLKMSPPLPPSLRVYW
jgi:hypothetical protein